MVSGGTLYSVFNAVCFDSWMDLSWTFRIFQFGKYHFFSSATHNLLSHTACTYMHIVFVCMCVHVHAVACALMPTQDGGHSQMFYSGAIFVCLFLRQAYPLV